VIANGRLFAGQDRERLLRAATDSAP